MSDYENSYALALEAAGATVHAFEEFGSYQGDWWAYVTYEGKTGWVTGCYGSCSGCDAFEAEFMYEKPSERAFAEFGKRYLEDIISTEEALSQGGKNTGWDIDADEMVAWIKKTSEDFKNV